MDEARFLALEQTVEAQGKLLEKVLASQQKIENALLGNLETSVPGLIEEQRNQRRQIEFHAVLLKEHTSELQQNANFRTDVKKIVALIAFAVPFLFEIFKGLFAVVWNHIKASL